MTHQEQALQDHWNSFFKTLQKALNNPTIQLPPINTNNYAIWHTLYLDGKQLGPATSFEYPSSDWNGSSIICQDFGSYRIEYYVANGNWFVWGPAGELAHG